MGMIKPSTSGEILCFLVEDRHLSYQFVARFNADLSDADYKPVQSPQFEQYCVCRRDPPLEEKT